MAHVLPSKITGPSPTELYIVPPYSRKSWIQAYSWVYFNIAFKEVTPELKAKMRKEYDDILAILGKEYTDTIFDYALRHGII